MSRKNKKTLVRVIAAGAIFVVGLFVPKQEEICALWFLRLGIYLAAYFTAGWDVLWKALRNIAHGHIFDENFLMAIASVGAMVMGEYSEGAAVMIFYQVGELFQSAAVGKSRRSISDMMDINPEYANVERGGEILQTDPQEVAVGEVIVVKAGERVPLDGVVVSGASGLNTAALTGESALREVCEGDEVISGCINTTGLIKVRVSRPYSDSTVARILELVENSSENKARSESFITKFARWYTPLVVLGAVLVGTIPPLVLSAAGGAFVGAEVWKKWIYQALTFLVVSCPCALVISVPLSYFGGIGGAARYGIMVKGANFLDALSRAQTFVFDKTGTLTKGSFSVTEIRPAKGIESDELLRLCAAAESFSTHPIAQCIVKAAREKGCAVLAENAQEFAGFGVRAVVSGEEIYAGNLRLMEKSGACAKEIDSAGTVVYCSRGAEYLGCVVINDLPKDGAREAVCEIKRLCAAKTVMLTGDRRAAGEEIAKRLGLDEVHTELLPDGKVAQVEKLYAEKPAKSTLVFVGDGMNDAPALARADVGIAMGGLGSDAAIEAADIVLMNDNIANISTAVKIARKTRRIVAENIVFALGVKAAVLVLAVLNISNMWAAVFADVGVSVIAIINAMRAMRVKS